MYNNPYINTYNPQISVDRINNQIAELEKMRSQLQQNTQPTAINQTFQLAPNQTSMRFVNTIDDVNKEFVINDTPFFSNDMSVLWVKNTKGDIKSYEIKEIVLKDEKDLLIDSLMTQIKELKKEMIVDESVNTNSVESIENKKPANVQPIRGNKKK